VVEVGDRCFLFARYHNNLDLNLDQQHIPYALVAYRAISVSYVEASLFSANDI
jgi:hypothetical protein